MKEEEGQVEEEGFPGAYVSHPAEHRLPQRDQVVDAHGPA